jgi:hypothetical protein
MYAYANVIIERHGVHALPVKALVYSGDQTFCWRYVNGHAKRTEVQTGINDGEWIEVTNQLDPASKAMTTPEDWKPFNGSEQIIMAQDLGILTDDEEVKVGTTTSGDKVSGATSEEAKKIKETAVAPSKS